MTLEPNFFLLRSNMVVSLILADCCLSLAETMFPEMDPRSFFPLLIGNSECMR